ncbi:hypothetical protein CCR85_04635 [Rhodothalassium salexigens]|uniref:phage tail protein n=1 Tax=Rhodothalassium salexigens TaxID=1086 RepID=UPI0019112949|nr:tail fiber protein [Rhodothalassium salexigens]MBK5910779.1 hypothetical protein [Rhodothalassium salexigens]
MPDASNAYIGDIALFAGNFAPVNWAFCNGAILSIATNQALFSIIGDTYGGDGRSTFALPDLRGRAPVHAANGSPGPGLTPVFLGQRFGYEEVVLTTAHLPSHAHTVPAYDGPATQVSPNGHVPAQIQLASGGGAAGYEDQANDTMGPTAATGGQTAVPNAQPSFGINFLICTQGLYPPRD